MVLVFCLFTDLSLAFSRFSLDVDDFIVDDDGYGYQDKGGEIWEYEDVHDNNDNKGKKNRKLNNVSLI